jgi:hypothetical protein
LITRYLSLAGDSTREDAESSVDKRASDRVREPRLVVDSPGCPRERQRRRYCNVVEMQSAFVKYSQQANERLHNSRLFEILSFD